MSAKANRILLLIYLAISFLVLNHLLRGVIHIIFILLLSVIPAAILLIVVDAIILHFKGIENPREEED